jgi:hypothetical protein
LTHPEAMSDERKRGSRTLRTSRRLAVAIWLLCHPADLRAETLTLGAALDATLIEDPRGELANGAGPALFVGRTSQSTGSLRRALLFFDVAAALPRGVEIESVELVLVLTPSHDPLASVSLHRVLSPWSEGPSASSGGSGAQAQSDDATWLHTRYPSEFWALPGGDHAPDASGTAAVKEPGIYSWPTTPALVADVQRWLDEPTSNHGWLLIGDESAPSTSKRFASRQEPNTDLQPRLRIEYRISCEAAGLAGGALGLCRAYCEALDCAHTKTPAPPMTPCARLAELFGARTGGLRPPCE